MIIYVMHRVFTLRLAGFFLGKKVRTDTPTQYILFAKLCEGYTLCTCPLSFTLFMVSVCPPHMLMLPGYRLFSLV